MNKVIKGVIDFHQGYAKDPYRYKLLMK